MLFGVKVDDRDTIIENFILNRSGYPNVDLSHAKYIYIQTFCIYVSMNMYRHKGMCPLYGTLTKLDGNPIIMDN